MTNNEKPDHINARMPRVSVPEEHKNNSLEPDRLTALSEYLNAAQTCQDIIDQHGAATLELGGLYDKVNLWLALESPSHPLHKPISALADALWEPLVLVESLPLHALDEALQTLGGSCEN